MRTLLLSANTAGNVQRAAEALLQGKLAAFPTDTVYGLGAFVFDKAAVQRIRLAKNRPPEKAIPVLLSSVDEIEQVTVGVGKAAMQLAERFWPGPLTIVVPKRDRVPDVVAVTNIGIRVPDHPIALALLGITGPMAVTSANLSGRTNPVSAAGVLEQLRGRVDIVLDGGTTPGGFPSTVVDCTGDELTILRPGPLALLDLLAALK